MAMEAWVAELLLPMIGIVNRVIMINWVGIRGGETDITAGDAEVLFHTCKQA
jgi:hypothetical protein